MVFIDEIHTVMGAGRSGDQGLDAANMLKPALSRGEFRCIGATTPDEYRRHIESDPSMERRFEKVLVGEPTREETLQILHGLKPKWEEHHQVRILDSALEAAVDFSLRYDTEHRLPDKAIDLVDKAAARTRVPVLSMRAPEQGGGSASASGGAVYGDVTEEAVAYVLAEKRGVPPERIMDGLASAEGTRLLELDKFLAGKLIGQDQAIHRVAQRIRLAHSGIKSKRVADGGLSLSLSRSHRSRQDRDGPSPGGVPFRELVGARALRYVGVHARAQRFEAHRRPAGLCGS